MGVSYLTSIVVSEYGHISHYKPFEYRKILISSLKPPDTFLPCMLFVTFPGTQSFYFLIFKFLKVILQVT